MDKKQTIVITMHNKKEIVIELYPEKAPNSVKGLLKMIEKKAYDGMSIQRIVPNFVLQPWYDETKMSDDFQEEINGEFSCNGFLTNDIEMRKYSVALAGDGKTKSTPSCFFITTGDDCKKKLQGHYAGIGHVIKGFDEIDRITKVPTMPVDIGVEGVKVNTPIKEEIIASIRIVK